MDILWSPWRYDYIKGSQSEIRSDCVFCDILSSDTSDEDNFILHRAEFNFVILNIYPYTSGHLLILPYEHKASISSLDQQVSNEMMSLIGKTETAINEVYTPDGLNIGINEGRAAGAGVAGHIHTHILPRWVGDANFMTAIGQTRTLPESLTETYKKLKPKFA